MSWADTTVHEEIQRFTKEASSQALSDIHALA